MDALRFEKWEGTGNDFVVIDDREGHWSGIHPEFVKRLCDRHLGIGSDGLILVQAPRVEGTAYHMAFFNPDASSSFCGNGSRCAYAAWSAWTGERGTVRFTAIDGEHEGGWSDGLVRIAMRPVVAPERIDEGVLLLDTGSPHLIVEVPDPSLVDLVPEARKWRYNERFAKAGVNVNFTALRDGVVHMRTYERGVEDETLSCGTGVTAAALSYLDSSADANGVAVKAPGGELRVEARPLGDGGYDHVFLSGPVRHVFTGEWQGTR